MYLHQARKVSGRVLCIRGIDCDKISMVWVFNFEFFRQCGIFFYFPFYYIIDLGAVSGAISVYHAHEFTTGFYVVHIAEYVFCVVFCRLLFVFRPLLYCLPSDIWL